MNFICLGATLTLLSVAIAAPFPDSARSSHAVRSSQDHTKVIVKIESGHGDPIVRKVAVNSTINFNEGVKAISILVKSPEGHRVEGGVKCMATKEFSSETVGDFFLDKAMLVLGEEVTITSVTCLP
jgi:hypothetical protein